MFLKYSILFLAIGFVQLNLFSQNSFYSVDSLREIRIYFYDTDWDSQLDNLYIQGNNDRILADLIIDGALIQFLLIKGRVRSTNLHGIKVRTSSSLAPDSPNHLSFPIL